MRIVADTNTVLSELLWQGPPRRLLDLARERRITLCTSLTLIAELAEVTARDKFSERVRAAGLSAAELVQDLATTFPNSTIASTPSKIASTPSAPSASGKPKMFATATTPSASPTSAPLIPALVTHAL